MTPIFILLTNSAFAQEAAAAEHHHGTPWHSFFIALFNFAILAMLLYFALRKPARDFFRQRATATRLEVDKARQLYDEARKQFEEIDAKLKNADLEGQKLVMTLRQEGEMERQRTIRQAREASQKIKMDAELLIGQELQRAKQSLKAETAELATKLAAQKIAAELGNEQHDRLNQDFISQVETLKVAGA